MGNAASVYKDPKLKTLEDTINYRNMRINNASGNFSDENPEVIEKEFRESLANIFSDEENQNLAIILKLDNSQNYSSAEIATLSDVLRRGGDDSLKENILFTFRDLSRIEINTLSSFGINVSNRISLVNNNENPSRVISRSTSNPILNDLGLENSGSSK
jgi:hypothetical protein